MAEAGQVKRTQEQLDALVATADTGAPMTQEENMETDNLAELRATEARIREAEADALAELAETKVALETAGRDDREAYAAALTAGESPPDEARTPGLIATIRDIEKRVLLAVDDALWQLAQDAREAIREDGIVEAAAFEAYASVGSAARCERSLAAGRHAARCDAASRCGRVGRAHARADRAGDRQG